MGNLIFAIVYTIASLLIGGWIGFAMLSSYLTGLLITASGGVLEVSMSMDNAIVNSSILRTMNPFWKKNYLLFGMPIAVVGMRFLIPIMIVSIAGFILPWDTVMMAIHNPTEYSKILVSTKPFIMAFGISFLTLIMSDFFINDEKDEHWFALIEEQLVKLSGVNGVHYTLALITNIIATLLFSTVSPNIHSVGIFFISGLIGISSYFVIKTISSYTEKQAGNLEGGSGGGFAQFLLLEAIDASFSFDGVIGAFAITQNIFLIMVSLGVGAVWVRYFTMLMANSKAIGELKYLSHGAFWNIAFLILTMVIGVVYELPAWVPGTMAILIIAGSVIHSLRSK